MTKTSYVCDKCGKIFENPDDMVFYEEVKISMSQKKANYTSSLGKVYNCDLCRNCNNLFEIRIKAFLEEISKEFNFK